MAILTGLDGKVYEIPDEKLSQFELPEELLAQLGAQHDAAPDAGPPDQDAGGRDASPARDRAAGDEDPGDAGPRTAKTD